MSFFEKILKLDQDLFFVINRKWNNSFFDLILPPARNSVTWIPFYLILLILILLKYKERGIVWVLAASGTAGLTDLISSRFIKHVVFRLRPCHETGLPDVVRFIVKYCPVSSSFTSSHAANHFGLAAFIYFTLSAYYGKWVGVIFLWAAVICYAQVYVGVHYPLDVICGAAVGLIIGYSTSLLFNKYGIQKKSLA
jgi:undecaprenyl-diphosphatase